jgi:outer membrane protein assembly factor BamD (BamD/ComL family)
LDVRARASTRARTPYKPTSATDAVETGTKRFEEEDYDDPLRLYNAAMEMRPNDDEARAATYNAACVHVKKKQWQKAVDNLKASVNDYGLKVKVVYEVRAWRRERKQQSLRTLVVASCHSRDAQVC